MRSAALCAFEEVLTLATNNVLALLLRVYLRQVRSAKPLKIVPFEIDDIFMVFYEGPEVCLERFSGRNPQSVLSRRTRRDAHFLHDYCRRGTSAWKRDWEIFGAVQRLRIAAQAAYFPLQILCALIGRKSQLDDDKRSGSHVVRPENSKTATCNSCCISALVAWGLRSQVI